MTEAERHVIEAALSVASFPPLKHSSDTVYAAKVPWHRIESLRAALEAAGYDWQRLHY